MQMLTRNVLLEMELEEDDDEDGDIGEWGAVGVFARKPEKFRPAPGRRTPRGGWLGPSASGRGGGNPQPPDASGLSSTEGPNRGENSLPSQKGRSP